MKQTLYIFLVTLLLLFAAVPAAAATVTHSLKDVSFSLDDSYTLYTDSDLLSSSTVEGLIFVALSADRNHQIQARSAVTDFSEELGSFAGLTADALAPVGDKLFPDGYETVTVKSTVFLKDTERGDNGYTVMYVTVAAGKLYTFAYFGDDPSRMGEFIGTVTLPSSGGGSNMKTYTVIIIAAFIAADIAFLVFLVLSFVRDYRRYKMEQSENIVSQYIKIKRRKY